MNKAIVYSPDRKTVLTSDGRRIARLWETSTGLPLGSPLRHGRNVRTVAFSPDGTRVATASHDLSTGLTDSQLSSIQIWDAATGGRLGPPIWRYRWVSALAFSPDGRVLAAGDYGRAVGFWDATTGRPVGAPLVQRGIVFSLAYSPDGKTLAVGTVDPVAEARLWDLASGQPIGEGMPHGNWVVEVAYSPLWPLPSDAIPRQHSPPLGCPHRSAAFRAHAAPGMSHRRIQPRRRAIGLCRQPRERREDPGRRDGPTAAERDSGPQQ